MKIVYAVILVGLLNSAAWAQFSRESINLEDNNNSLVDTEDTPTPTISVQESLLPPSPEKIPAGIDLKVSPFFYQSTASNLQVQGYGINETLVISLVKLQDPPLGLVFVQQAEGINYQGKINSSVNQSTLGGALDFGIVYEFSPRFQLQLDYGGGLYNFLQADAQSLYPNYLFNLGLEIHWQIFLNDSDSLIFRLGALATAPGSNIPGQMHDMFLDINWQTKNNFALGLSTHYLQNNTYNLSLPGFSIGPQIIFKF